MEKVLWVVGVMLYLVGYVTTFRLMYRSEIDNIYKDVSECKTCKKDLENYEAGKDPELRMCSDHIFRTGDWLKVIAPVAFGILSLMWPVALVVIPFYFTITMLGWLIKRTLLNVKSEAKDSWEYAVREATVIRLTEELTKQMERLGIEDNSSKLRKSLEMIEVGFPVPPEWLHGVKSSNTVNVWRNVNA